MKFIIFLFISTQALFSQLHHQSLVSQGKVFAFSNKFVVSQSIGQQSVAGTYVNPSLVVQQGFQQSMQNSNTLTSTKSSQITTKVYPNPFDSFINFGFSTEIHEEMVITIFDVSGRLVYKVKKMPVQNVLTINSLEILAKGNYVINLKSISYNFYEKLIKN